MSDQGLQPFVPPPTPAAQQQSQFPTTPRQVAPNASMTGIGDESVKKYEFELFTPQVGKTDRIFLINPGTGIAKRRSHFHDKLKSGSVLCKSEYVFDQATNQEVMVKEATCCKLLGSPNLRFAMLVIVYNTDQNGQPLQPFKYFYKLWRFGADKFQQLRTLSIAAINAGGSLTQQDLTVLCTEKQYMRLTITPAGPSWILNPKFPEEARKRIFKWAQDNESKLVDNVGGKEFDTDAELMQYLATSGVIVQGGAPPQTVVQPGDAPVQSFEDIIGGTIDVTPTEVQ